MTTNEIRAMLESFDGDQLVEVGVLLEHERIRRYGRRSEWMTRQGIPVSGCALDEGEAGE